MLKAETETRRSRQVAAVAVNALVVVLEAWAIGVGVSAHGLAGNFVYYTECSNLLGAAACALCLAGEVRALRGGPGPGKAARLAKYAASCCLLMTLLVVVAVLAPMLESVGQPGFFLMFADGAKPVTHLFAPLLVAGSYVLFEADSGMTLRQSLAGLVPTLVYAAVAYPCNIARLWDGPYPFLQVWDMPAWMGVLWFAALLMLAFGLCQVPRLLGRLLGRREA